MPEDMTEQIKRLMAAKERLYQKSSEVQDKKNMFKKKRQKLVNDKEEFIKAKEYNLKIITENKIRYKRAIVKTTEEIKKRKELKVEFQQCAEKTEELKGSLEMLTEKILKMNKYHKFIQETIDILPDDYFAGVSDPEKLIFRHGGLSNSLNLLSISFAKNINEINIILKTTYDLRSDEEKCLLFRNKDLCTLYSLEQKIQEESKEIEIGIFNEISNLREFIRSFGLTIRSVDNITEKCISRKNALFLRYPTNETVTHMTVVNKIASIKNFINSATSVLEYLDIERSQNST